MLKKLLIALTSGLLTLIALIVAASSWLGTPPSDLVHALSGQDPPGSRFEAHYVIRGPQVDERCGYGLEWRTAIWWGGPEQGLETYSSDELARLSLDWFENSWHSETWLKHTELRLDLIYTSGDRDISIRHRRGSSIPWARQLEAWFKLFPPTVTGGRPEWSEGDYSWNLRFGEGGVARGTAASAEDAIAAMQLLGTGLEPSSILGAPNFELGLMVRADPRWMNCYSADTGEVAELEALPGLLREQCVAFESIASELR